MDNELKLFLFLHVLAAAVMAGGILGFALLVGRARGTGSAAEQSEWIGPSRTSSFTSSAGSMVEACSSETALAKSGS